LDYCRLIPRDMFQSGATAAGATLPSERLSH